MSFVPEFALCTKSIHCIDEREILWQCFLSPDGLKTSMQRNKAKCLMSVADLRPCASDMVLACPPFPE